MDKGMTDSMGNVFGHESSLRARPSVPDLQQLSHGLTRILVCAGVGRHATTPTSWHLPLAISGNAAPLLKSSFIGVQSALIRG